MVAGCLGCACQRSGNNASAVDDPINIASPQPKEAITKMSLSETEKDYVDAGSSLAFKLFNLLVKPGESAILSPLSIQYALGMTANGASGETLEELTRAMGFTEGGIEALNTFCHKLLNELPALDLDVTLKLADAILVNQNRPLLPSFKETVQDTYYAAVENMSFDDPNLVAARINDWASRNTNGLIDKMLDAREVSPMAVAYLMNALYFKAKWAGSEYDPMFQEYGTYDEPFHLSGSDVKELPTLHAYKKLNYAQFKGFGLLELPYAGDRFAMYILLPDGDLQDLVKDFPTLNWKELRSRLSMRDVNLQLPKFETSSSFMLKETLQALGVKRAFELDEAQFDRMFQPKSADEQFAISKVIQKARISVAEWGTEAAAVTVVEMVEKSAMPAEKPVNFICDRPFAYIIAEKSEGVILFEGAFAGK